MTPLTMEQAEAEFHAAIASDDPEAIARFEAIIDKLDSRPVAASLHSAALWYAQQGLPVFPLQPGSKIPFKGSNGCKGATTDPELVDRMWTGNPDANIGLATGHVVDVVDIDTFEGQKSRVAHWEDTFERIDADALAKVLTPRPGGMHIYVPATGDGNSAGIFPGIDYRGRGGYVVAPPSRTDVGTYRFLGTPKLDGLHRVAA